MRNWIYEGICSSLRMIRRRLVTEGFNESVELLDQLQASIDQGPGEEIPIE